MATAAHGDEDGGGWFAWALPTSMAGAPDDSEQGAQPHGPGARQPQLPNDTNLAHSMTRAMVTTHADQFNARLDKELAVQARAIESLRARVDGGSGSPSVMDDVQAIIDVMRRDLNSQRELLMQVNEQIPSLREEVNSLKQGGAQPGAVAPGADGPVVSLKQHEQAFSALQADMNSLHRATELAAVKAGFLAVASSECSLEERAKLFETLKAKEEALQHGHARKPEAIGDIDGIAPKTRSWERSLASNATANPGPNPPNPQMPSRGSPPTMNPRLSSPDPGTAEFAVRLDKSRGDPLGLQIDHEDGSTLLVDAVFDGLVKWWNDANPDLAVLPGDRIVAVNGKRGNIDMLLRETEGKQVLTLLVQRTNR